MTEHYFSTDPSAASRPRLVTARAWGQELRLESASGVFSSTRVDPGTAVMFRSTQPPAGGTLLDLGCGYGVIGCALATAAPEATVWAVDVNARALELTRSNAERLGLKHRLHVAPPDEVPGDVRFDAIWSNPPIRIGKQALHRLLLDWLARLHPAGEAILVVGRHLGADSLQRWLNDQGYTCERLASAKGFRVLRAQPSASSSQSQ